MADALADRVLETTTTTGTGTLNLGGAETNYQSFVDGVGDGNDCYYCIEDNTNNEWEVGYGRVNSGSPNTLTRTAAIDSSNSGALVNLGAGTKNVFVTYPGARALFVGNAEDVAVPGDIVFGVANPYIEGNDTDGVLTIAALTNETDSAAIQLFGPTHATQANDFGVYANNALALLFDYSDLQWEFQAMGLQGTGALAFSGGGSLTGTWSDLGSVTTVDLNGGTIDGTVIGGTTPAAGTFTALTSNGLDDNATQEVWQLADGIATVGPASGGYEIRGADASQYLLVGSQAGIHAIFYAGSHATLAQDLNIRSNAGTSRLYYDHSASSWNFQATTVTGTGALSFSGGGSLTGTWTDMGSVTTIDINGGTIDATVIGGTSAAAGTFAALTATGAFTSLGIDDNATGERVQIGDGSLLFGTASTEYVLARVGTDSDLRLSGDASGGVGANYAMFGSTHATAAGDHLFRDGTTNILRYDKSVPEWNFQGEDVQGVGNFEAANGNFYIVELSTACIIQNSANENVLVGDTNADTALFYNNVECFRTTDNDANYFITGAEVLGHDGNWYDVGRAKMAIVEDDATETFDETDVEAYVHIDAGTGITKTLPSGTSGAVPPVGSVIVISNEGANDISVAASGTLRWFSGTGTPSTGTRTLSEGGIMSCLHYSDTEWHCWGFGIS